ncbi:MAG: RNA polymerase sigma factor [Bacteroidales bacterium]|nr:RNA polymerase sigma factor [Bacteroidales bacterium]
MLEQEKVFNELVKQYSEPLYWHVRAMVGSHEDADDLLQEIFIKVWNSLGSFRGDSDAFTWLWRIATNEAISHLRKARVRAALSFSRLDANAERVSDPNPYFDGDEAMRKLRKALLRLPDKQRTVFAMRYWEDLSYEQISEITGTSVGALKASYHFAYEKVKQYLTGED